MDEKMMTEEQNADDLNARIRQQLKIRQVQRIVSEGAESEVTEPAKAGG